MAPEPGVDLPARSSDGDKALEPLASFMALVQVSGSAIFSSELLGARHSLPDSHMTHDPAAVLHLVLSMHGSSDSIIQKSCTECRPYSSILFSSR